MSRKSTTYNPYNNVTVNLSDEEKNILLKTRVRSTPVRLVRATVPRTTIQLTATVTAAGVTTAAVAVGSTVGTTLGGIAIACAITHNVCKNDPVAAERTYNRAYKAGTATRQALTKLKFWGKKKAQ